MLQESVAVTEKLLSQSNGGGRRKRGKIRVVCTGDEMVSGAAVLHGRELDVCVSEAAGGGLKSYQ